jgi:predicted  nucleic acid-binding Zn-ribbon protein
MAATAALTGAAALAAAGQRSVSDGGAQLLRQRQQQQQQQHSGGQSSSSSASPPSAAGPNQSVARGRSVSNTSLARRHTPEPLKLRPDSPGINANINVSPTPTPPPLRRIDRRVSGDLRSLRQHNNSSRSLVANASANANAIAAASASASASTPTPTPVANEGRVRSARDTRESKDRDMADVFDGFGEGRMGSPRSPTRPHSMRRRQSMQVIELESRVEQLIAENRLLTDARHQAEQNLNVTQRAASVLTERDAEIEALKQSLHFLRNEVTRLTEVNEGLTSANAELASKDSRRYADLEVRHAEATRELDQARGARNEFDQTLRDKDAQIADLRAQLDDAKEQVRDMQRQILESKGAVDADFLDIRDEDYFDHRCQQLCSHVQQWVLRFSKFSDMRACRLTAEINDEKTIDRLDNAVLDGSDVDVYLRDRVKRRDIFMSMTMNMIWEFVFTRYLFGMDREQRQKLKSLEKLLTEVGPAQAVRQWRAVTLTLLSRRDTFKHQRDQDTEAVVQAVFQTLCKILPPPSNLEGQIQSQLRRVMREAVDLSVEMRTQRAEYIMLPPLQPEYDADGELAATVQFNSSMMSERGSSSGMSNEELEAAGAVVRIVLFPLVVKKGDDGGVGDEEIVVCPAQVLVVREKTKRHGAPSSDAGGASLGARSHLSVVTEHMSGLPDGSDI